MTPFSQTFLIAGRELRSYFLQPLAWVVLTAIMILNGWNFWMALAAFNKMGLPSADLVRFFFSGLLFWLPLLVSIPVIAMRLVAEERQTGTLETLLTAPVSDGQVALGKYLAALGFFTVLWSPMVIYVGLLRFLGGVDWRPAAGGFLGLFLVGSYLLAATMAASALTRNQIVAAIVGFVVVMTLFLTPFLVTMIAGSEPVRRLFEYSDLMRTMDDFPRGLIDSRRLLYPISGIVLFVFLTARLIEASRGK